MPVYIYAYTYINTYAYMYTRIYKGLRSRGNMLYVFQKRTGKVVGIILLSLGPDGAPEP